MTAFPINSIPGFAGPLNPIANVTMAAEYLERYLLQKITDYNRAAAYVRIVGSRGIRNTQEALQFAKTAGWVNSNKANYESMMKNIDSAIKIGGAIAPGWANQWNSTIGVAITAAGQGLSAAPALIAIPLAILGSAAARNLILAAVAAYAIAPAIGTAAQNVTAPPQTVTVETKPDGTKVTTTTTGAGAFANIVSPVAWLPLLVVGGLALWVFSRRR